MLNVQTFEHGLDADLICCVRQHSCNKLLLNQL